MDPTLEGATWLDQELAGCTFPDDRLTKRLRKLLEQLGGAMGASLPLACQDWAATKAAYRFFTNERVSEREILAGHFDTLTKGQHVAHKIVIGPLLDQLDQGHSVVGYHCLPQGSSFATRTLPEDRR